MPELIEVLVRVLAKKAAAAGAVRADVAVVELAAHLFAAATLLEAGSTDASWMFDGKGVGFADVPSALTALENLEPSSSGHEIHRCVVAALMKTEQRLLADWESGDFLPPRTRLDPDGAEIGLEGVVHHWLRPPSLLAELRSIAEESLEEGAPHPPTRTLPSPLAHLRRLGMYWEQRGLPRLELVRQSTSAALISASIEHRLRQGCFRIALCPLPPEVAPLFRIDPAGKEFTSLRSEALLGRPALERCMRELFDDAAKHSIDVLVLPELCVDERGRAFLADLLRPEHEFPSLVVAGSFHFWQGEDERPVNEAIVLDAAGDCFWRHEKRGVFPLDRRLVVKHPELFHQRPEAIEAELLEGIRHGDALSIWECSLGRLAVLICADAIQPDEKSYRQLVQRLRPDIVIVVSLSLETELFEQALREFRDLNVSALYVNAACATAAGGRSAPAAEGAGLATDDQSRLVLATLALWHSPGMPATQVRWRPGHAAEWYDFHAPRAWRWKPVVPRLVDAGVGLLPGGRGLVIDLGCHYRSLNPPEQAEKAEES